MFCASTLAASELQLRRKNSVDIPYIFQFISKIKSLKENLTIACDAADIYAKESIQKSWKIMACFQYKRETLAKHAATVMVLNTRK